MWKTIKNVVKDGGIMFAVGALLALAAPYLAEAVGINPGSLGHTADWKWMGAFFGTFGAIHAVVKPMVESVLGKDKPEVETVREVRVERAMEPDLAQSRWQDQVRSQERGAEISR